MRDGNRYQYKDIPLTGSRHISVAEAAEILRLSEISIRRFLTQKKLVRYKVGGRTLVLRSEVEAMIKRAP